MESPLGSAALLVLALAALPLAGCDVSVPILPPIHFPSASPPPISEPRGPSDSKTSLSADGRYVAFASQRSDLVAGDGNGKGDVFVRDTWTATVVRVSVASDGTEADGPSGDPSISGDGRYVAFESNATNLISGTTSSGGVFVHDVVTGATTLIRSGTLYGRPTISADGRYVTFAYEDINYHFGYVHDRWTGTTASLTAAPALATTAAR